MIEQTYFEKKYLQEVLTKWCKCPHLHQNNQIITKIFNYKFYSKGFFSFCKIAAKIPAIILEIISDINKPNKSKI